MGCIKLFLTVLVTNYNGLYVLLNYNNIVNQSTVTNMAFSVQDQSTKVQHTSHPALKKSEILHIGTKYPTWGFPVVAVPQYTFISFSCNRVFNLSSPSVSWKIQKIEYLT